ncbi:hypothetical protein DSM44344_03850 [Mycobacterium marinum]|nr:hypothetical protein DSM44344_03850 [Mycobacterium marinum]
MGLGTQRVGVQKGRYQHRFGATAGQVEELQAFVGSHRCQAHTLHAGVIDLVELASQAASLTP